MSETPYNMPPLGLFGKRCRILTGYDKRPFVYRIVNSEWRSNTWSEPPLTYWSETTPVRHDHSEDVLIVVCDTLIDDKSRLIRVALKDVELMDNAPTIEADPVKHGRWIKDESTYAGPGLDNLQCSECKRNAVTWRRDIPLSRMYRYCPNCGAKMDGGADDGVQGL